MIPEDNLILGDFRLLTILPPRDILLGDDAPQRVVLTGNIGLHSTQIGVVGGRGRVELLGEHLQRLRS